MDQRQSEGRDHRTESARRSQLLALIEDDPKASQASLAIKMGWTLYSGEPHKTKVKRCIANLKRDKLINETRGGIYKLTAEGKKVLAPE